MENFKSNSFEFYTFDTHDEKHQRALYELEDDPLIKRWFGKFSNYFFDSAFDVSSSLSGNFLVGKDDDIIGFVSLYDYSKCVELDYGLIEKFRGVRLNSEHTIGSLVLLETSEEILKNNARIEYLRCYIDLQNVRSINTAKKAGFVQYKDIIAGYGEYHKDRHI